MAVPARAHQTTSTARPARESLSQPQSALRDFGNHHHRDHGHDHGHGGYWQATRDIASPHPSMLLLYVHLDFAAAGSSQHNPRS
jgi:hypothetical protein